MGWLAAVALAAVIEISCGQVYRPVVIPTSTTPPDPANFHAVFGISANAPFNPGTALQIDVSGDTNIGVAHMGVNPTHAAILPNNSRVFVASAGSLNQGDADVVTAFSPAFASSVGTGLGSTTTFTFPNIGPIDPNTGLPSFVCSYRPDFVATTQSNAVYVANFGVDNDANCNLSSTDSVAVLSTSQNNISNIAYLPAGSHPVALAETPNALNLYVVNQGSNSIIDLSPTDMSTLATIPVGVTPVWAVSRLDGLRVYVVTQGDGQLYTIRTDTNTVVSNQSVGGPGANFVLYDKSRNRLYVTNPGAGAVYVFDATSDSPTLLAAIPFTAGSTPCPNGCSPVSVAALPDGSRFYVASYQIAPACPDASIGNGSSCVIPRLTVFDASSLSVKPISASQLSPSISLFGQPKFSSTQYAVPPVASCAAVTPYAPGTTRFRMFATASADSSHVYVSLCDAGAIADINATTSTIATGGNNTPDVLVTDLIAPFGACTDLSICNAAATISSFSIASNVATFQAANTFVAGQKVAIAGLTAGNYMNGLTFTVLPTGLSGSQFEIYVAHADVASTTDAGTATPAPPAQTPILLLTGQ
jgi:6-phosphogluconolactonase (cycloisomerase 2 family)